MKINVWFNHWFSSLASVIENLKKNNPDIVVHVTNRDKNCVYFRFADFSYIEPQFEDDNSYVEWALKFCADNYIDVFVVRGHNLAISQNINKFRDIGVHLLIESYDIIQKFESKSKTYEMLRERGYTRIPEYNLVNSTEEFISAYKKYRKDNQTVCIKLDTDEGASSFKVVSDEFLCAKSLFEPVNNLVSFENTVNMMRDAENKGVFRPFMVMPKMGRPEISVDCYRLKNDKLVMIPRYKLGSRIKQIKFDKNILNDCESIYDIIPFSSICNIQYRYCRNEFKLLEINTRISGGIHLSTLSGIDLIDVAIKELLGLNYKIPDSLNECMISQFETPVILYNT